jgi:hypothetical protein
MVVLCILTGTAWSAWLPWVISASPPLSFASLGFVGIELSVTLKRNLGLDSSSVAPLTETTLLRAAKVVQFSQTWPLDETEKSPAVCDVIEYMLQW